ncbi:hypothetical protein EYZ11_001050 [Aspergillus tanneri]|uniref:NAD(P)-binding domain-containing protein n=1 Tax=Aspergillus tanneri TaxID=1220188 RepID=A0A4S3JVP3_9EURO|nr:hypothetical protein EYZ11_001050 [Aspergillus tanneri]
MAILLIGGTRRMNEFVAYARHEHEVGRFVLVSGTSAQPGKPGMGMVWKNFLQTGVDFCVLRPSWFMATLPVVLYLSRRARALTRQTENLSEESPGSVIKDHSKIYTACGAGRIPFVCATDIAAVAFHALTDTKSHNYNRTSDL